MTSEWHKKFTGWSGPPSLTVDQIKEGCALLNWTTAEVAQRANISRKAAQNATNPNNPASEAAVARIRAAMEAAGIEFDGQHGVRLRGNIR
jgi:hypothetical protein